MEKTFKRLLSFAVALVMVLGLLPVTQIEVKAAETEASTIVTAHYFDAATTSVKTRQVDYAKANAPLVLDDPDGDGTGEAFCHACGATKTWVRVTKTLQTQRAEEGMSLHYYVDEDITTTAKNMDTNGEETDTSTEGSFFWAWPKGGSICVHIAEGKTLDISTYIHNGGGTLNMMGKGTLIGGTNAFAERGKAISNFGWNAVTNLFGNTYKAKTDVNVLSLASGGTYGNKNNVMNIFADAVVEGKFYQRLGILNLHGGTINGNVTITNYCTDETNGVYTTSYFHMTDGEINGRTTLTRAAGAKNLASVKCHISGGTVNGLGTLEDRASSGTAFLMRQGAHLVIDGTAVINAGYSGYENLSSAGGDDLRTWGGAIYTTGATDVNDPSKAQTLIEMNGGTINAAGQGTDNISCYAGGAIYLYDDGTTKGADGAAASSAPRTKMVMTGGTINGGYTRGAGGSVYINRGEFEMTGGTIQNGHAATSSGGNINASTTSLVTISGGIISGGESTSAYGGNIFADGKFTMTGGTVKEGTALRGGNIQLGGVSVIRGTQDKKVIIQDGVGTNKTVDYGGGGNVFVKKAATLSIEHAQITGGETGFCGGNLYFEASSADTVQIKNSTISDGFAKVTGTAWYGGGNIYCGNRTYNIENTQIFGGVAEGSGGNIMGTSGSRIHLKNGTSVYGGTAKTDTGVFGGGNIQTSGGHTYVEKGAAVYGGTAANTDTKSNDIGAIYGGTVNINGGTVGNAQSTNSIYLLNHSTQAKFIMTDGTVYGKILATNSSSATTDTEFTVSHGKLTDETIANKKEAGTTLSQHDGLYEIHTVAEVPGTDASCTEAGTVAHYACSVCQQAFTDDTCATKLASVVDTAKPAHTQTETKQKDASCTEDGHKAYWTCSCGKTYEDAQCKTEIADLATWLAGDGKLDKIAHTYIEEVAEEYKVSGATCTAKAVYKKSCEVCGIAHETERFEDGAVLEHDYSGENGACVNGCGKTICENNGHAWGEEIEAKAATCTEKGNIAYYDCANCDAYAVGEEKVITAWDQIEIAIDADAHKYSNWVEVDENTHKRVCAYNEEHVETADHVYENGACVCGKDINAAQVGDTKYDTLQKALDAVAQTGGEIKLLKETTVTEDISVGQNVKLDLNGQKLIALPGTLVVAYTSESFITDSSDDNSGRLVADISQLRLLENNPQLPVKMADGIMFVEAKSGNQKAGADKNYQCWIDSADEALIDALTGKNASELALEFQVVITWGNNVLKYTFKDTTVAEYIKNWNTHAMFLTITGAEGIDDLKYQARIVFADDTDGEVVVWAGDIVDHS